MERVGTTATPVSFEAELQTLSSLLSLFQEQAAGSPPADPEDLIDNDSLFLNALADLLPQLKAADDAPRGSCSYMELEALLTTSQGSCGDYKSLYQIADEEDTVSRSQVIEDLAKTLFNGYSSGDLFGTFANTLHQCIASAGTPVSSNGPLLPLLEEKMQAFDQLYAKIKLYSDPQTLSGSWILSALGLLLQQIYSLMGQLSSSPYPEDQKAAQSKYLSSIQAEFAKFQGGQQNYPPIKTAMEEQNRLDLADDLYYQTLNNNPLDRDFNLFVAKNPIT